MIANQGEFGQPSLPSGEAKSESERVLSEDPLMLEVTWPPAAEERLASVEERFQLMVTGVADHGFFLITPDGRIRTWNVGAKNLFGYEEEEIVGEPFSRLFRWEDQQAGAPERELKTAAETGVARDDRWHLRKDGTVFWTNGITTALRNGGLRGFAKLVHDVTEQKRAEEALRESETRYRQLAEQLDQKSQALEELNRQKDLYLAILSHELRNPLTPMHNAIQLLQETREKAPLVAKATEVLARQMHVLSRLVDDLLDAARFSSGRIRLRKQLVELRELIQSAVEGVRPHIAARQQHLSVTIFSEPIHLEVDPVRIEQVITNLLNNASKYTPVGGNLWLTAVLEEGTAVIRIRDDGIGIPPEMLPRLFKYFTQLEQTTTESEGGLGIGLALARSIVQMHSGSIEAHSDGIEQGSEFVVRLPCRT